MNISHISEWFNTWSVTRAAGLTAFLLLGLSVISGMLSHWKYLGPGARAKFNISHQWTGWFGWLMVVSHIVALWLDSYVDYSWSEILIPFSNPEQRWANGLGSLSFYLIFLIIISSDFFRRTLPRLWRWIHLSAFPAFFLMLVHGIWIGTDSARPGILILYVSLTSVFLVLVMARRILKAETEQSAARTKPVANKK